MGKVAVTMSLMKASWQLLKKDKELLLLPVISGICCLSVMTIFVVQGLEHGWLRSFANDATAQQKNTVYWFMFLFYYCNYLVIVFFNSAIIACAVIRMNGGNPTLGDGLQAAVNRFPQIAGWAFIAATIGFILGMIESGSQRGRGIIAGILGISWSVISYLAIPLIIVEKTNPLVALDFSMEMMHRTWGEQVIGNFSFGLIFSLFSLPVLPILFLLGKTWGASSFLPAIIFVSIYLIILSIFQSALQTIFNAVMYVFASGGRVPDEFSAKQLKGAMRQI
ncbi:MAG TPA: DUF6159 family protein [Geobacteraceae bacterium]